MTYPVTIISFGYGHDVRPRRTLPLMSVTTSGTRTLTLSCVT